MSSTWWRRFAGSFRAGRYSNGVSAILSARANFTYGLSERTVAKMS